MNRRRWDRFAFTDRQWPRGTVRASDAVPMCPGNRSRPSGPDPNRSNYAFGNANFRPSSTRQAAMGSDRSIPTHCGCHRPSPAPFLPRPRSRSGGSHRHWSRHIRRPDSRSVFRPSVRGNPGHWRDSFAGVRAPNRLFGPRPRSNWSHWWCGRWTSDPHLNSNRIRAWKCFVAAASPCRSNLSAARA